MKTKPVVSRSSTPLSVALRNAGLGNADPEPHDRDEVTETKPVVTRSSKPLAAASVASSAPVAPDSAAPSAIVTPPRSPRLAFFAELDESSATSKLTPPQGVVSPPPWVRAARRGRWHALMLNTFGWTIALVVAGSIIGVAGRYLAVSPPGIATTMQARQ
ncbi:hypothetical protein [Hyphomicrobium sp.]|uniref:hypothetical protein n=1 Tax=Hyphomicrobium sp. TaxID=82 RepID=UPI0025C3CC3A|nr:hypothetical protein [Hyphomicrobium sp.]MCC7250600.1 hypothetical protein [Hyphomicrobium sp.]